MSENSFDQELIRNNLLGATTLKELYKAEKLIVAAKMSILNVTPIELDLDYIHLKKIHHFLFSEVYTWAGRDRYEANISAKFGKGTTLFTPYDKLPAVAQSLFDSLKKENYFQGQERETFVNSAAIFMNGLNILHPFREGNGRVQRIFMTYLAQKAGYNLSFQNIISKEMIAASIQGALGDTTLLENIFDQSVE